jgi:tRNA(Ile)-lysidine synthase
MPHKEQKRRSTPRAGRESLAGRLLSALKKQEVFRAGERIGVAVSGGADSVALLLLLLELREELGIVLSVAHLNHKLRGRAANGDEKFVAKMAAKHGLTLYAESADVAAKVRREKANLEDAARRARYDFFSRLVEQGKVDRVATAHTADDQAETVLAHILRGTGLAGLGGIHPQTESVVRPLLQVRRAELRAYLRTRKQRWREDATNRDTTRMRARIRKKLLPLLERDFQAGVVEHLGTLSQFAQEDEEFLEWMARERCEEIAKRDASKARIAIADLLLPWKRGDLSREHTERKESTKNTKETDDEKKEGGGRFAALTKRIIRRLIEERKKGTGQITAGHIALVMELARSGENGKTLQLPGGLDMRREHDDLVFRAEEHTEKHGLRRNNPAGPQNYEYKIDLRKNDAATLRVPEAGCVLRLRVIDWPAEREETTKLGTVLDRDRLRSTLVLRNWRPGDKLQPTGHQKPHKLKRLFNKNRISRWEREGWPVMTSGGIVIWARGFPGAAGFVAGEGTRKGILIAEDNTLDA